IRDLQLVARTNDVEVGTKASSDRRLVFLGTHPVDSGSATFYDLVILVILVRVLVRCGFLDVLRGLLVAVLDHGVDGEVNRALSSLEGRRSTELQRADLFIVLEAEPLAVRGVVARGELPVVDL